MTLLDPLSALCPICFASIGAGCRSIMPNAGGARHAEPCDPHPSRIVRAQANNISNELRERGWGLVPPVGEDQTSNDNDEEESMPESENSNAIGVPDDSSLLPDEIATPVALAESPDTTVVEAPANNEPVIVQGFKLVELDVVEGLAKLKEQTADDCFLLALRCPCGFLMGMGIPKETFAQMTALTVASKAAQGLVSMIIDHIELLDAKITRFAATPTRQRGPDFPTDAELAASYHNHPCPLRSADGKNLGG